MKREMEKLRRIIIVVFSILILIVLLFYMDYKNLLWNNNRGNYLGIISGCLGIVSQ
jgi:hypothetical protein